MFIHLPIKKEAKSNNDKITKSVPLISIKAIKKPPIACPKTEAVRNVPCVSVIAFGKLSLGTVLGTIEETIGQEKHAEFL
jgi:hypothetical protein